MTKLFGNETESLKSSILITGIEHGHNPQHIKAMIDMVNEQVAMSLIEKAPCNGCTKTAPEVPHADYFAGDLEEVAGVIHKRLENAMKAAMTGLHAECNGNKQLSQIVEEASRRAMKVFCNVAQDIATPGYCQKICEDI